jgi:four helix bundle protein
MRAPAKTFQDSIVWQKAHAFVLQVYAATRVFPRDEMYGLTSQFRRAAVSVPANIAEGFRKQSKPEKVRFLNISEGSLEQCRYYLLLAADLGYLDKEALWKLSEEVGRLLHGYRSAILTPNSSVLDSREPRRGERNV